MQLDGLNAGVVAAELGPTAILLCWEAEDVECHRSQVRSWFAAWGIIVSEYVDPQLPLDINCWNL